MKKHLIAAAVAAAVAVPAAAQVTVSGRIDTSYGSAKNGAGVSTNRITSSVLVTNQLTLSGSEDLGGGLKANFNITTGFASDAANSTTADTQVATAADADNKTVSTFNLGDRGMQVGVSGGFGAIDIGRTTGTMLNSTTASGVTGNIGNLSTLDARPNNMVSYTSPSISGLTVRGIMAVGSETKPTTGKHTELSAQYANGPVLVRVAQASYKDVSIAAAAASTTIFGGTSGGSALTDAKIKETGAQLDYDLGMAKVNIRYQKRDHTNSGNLAKDFDQYGVGASVPLGGGLSVNVDYVDQDSKTDASDLSIISATLVKSLSKRTNVYLAIASKDNDSGATNPQTERLTAVGVRHSF